MTTLDPTDPTLKKKPLPGEPGGGLAPLGEQQAQMPLTDPGQQIDGPPPIPKLGGGLGPAPGVALGDPNRPAPQIGRAPAPDALPAGASDMGNGLVKFADGQVLPKNHPAYAAKIAAAQPAAPAAPSAPAAPVAPAGTPGAPAAAQPATTNTAFQDALMKLLNPGEVSASSASVAPAIEANKLAEQRSVEANRNMLAEQAAKDGTDMSGGFRTNLIGLNQDSAARQGKFAGDAVTHAKDQQLSSLLAALGIGGSFLGNEADRAQRGDQFGKTLEEQKREADTDAEMKRLGITSQTDLGNKDLSLRDKLGSGQLNLGLLGQQIGNSNFKDNLGATLGMHNQDAILKILGMV